MTTRSLVCVFLRGGADGLTLVPPHGDPDYRRLRPTLAVERPLDLDGRFALHPLLAPLMPAWRNRELAIVHAVGSDDGTRSHFEAQERMERAGAREHAEPSGWITRHLRTRSGPTPSTLSAVAIGTAAPDALSGAPAVAVLETLDDAGPPAAGDPSFTHALDALYGRGAPTDALHAAGRDAIAALRRLAAARRTPARSGVTYPDHAFGHALRDVARLVRARVGMEIACVDLGGWDTHFTQASAIAEPVKLLGDGLAAFRADLGDDLRDVTVVVMTEFGRRAYENASLGTDHGRAGAMLVLGGHVRGGRVAGEWPGLSDDALEPPGDLRVTTDYRDVLGELIRVALGNDRARDVFPGWTVRERGVCAA